MAGNLPARLPGAASVICPEEDGGSAHGRPAGTCGRLSAHRSWSGGAELLMSSEESDPPEENRPPVRVFISYAHESEEHRAAVCDLWLLLRECGIDARLDRTAAEQREDWGLWMLEQEREADFVLVIVSPAYRRRAEGTEEAGKGLGVQWEGALIRDAFYRYRAAARRRFLPVLLPGASVEDIPAFF